MLHQLAPLYIDTGKAKVVYRHYAFLGQESNWAAQAAECANEQGQFHRFANYLFTHQAGENQGSFSRPNLKQFAQALGLDNQQFNACLDSGKYDDFIQKEQAEGSKRGVKATPSFFINGQFVEGLPATVQLARAIEVMQPR